MENHTDSGGLYSYTLIRSDRKTLSLIVKGQKVLVRAPYRMALADIQRFVDGHAGWIVRKLREQKERLTQAAAVSPLTESELRKLHLQAAAYIPARVAHFAPLVGVSYGKISFRIYKSKWGSCTSDGRLQFNTLLMLAPPEVIDSVVVHELCHRKVMNHSSRFYQEVTRVMPDYARVNRWLKDNRDLLMARAGLL